jgi:hypothetical protein
MSTDYSMQGSITITPHLSFAEIRTAQKAAMDFLRPYDNKRATEQTVFENYLPLKIFTDEYDKETDDGTLHVVRGIALVPPYTSGSMSYNMDELVKVLQKALPGHNWDGEVTAVRDDVTMAYKLVCKTEDGSDFSTVKQIEGKTYVRWEDDSQDEQIVSLTC